MIKRPRNVMKLLTLELLILLVINVNTISGIVNSSCTFESGQCGWSANGFGSYKWKRQRGNSRHSCTGPDKDHTTSSDANQYILENGYYFCTVSRSNSKENDVSDLHSGLINQCPKQFLTFWYHMNGRNSDTLKVFQVKNARLIELWRTAANQGNNWQFQSLSLEDIGPYQIMFRATRGTGIKSEIAVDDIFLNNTECKKVNNNSVTRDPVTVGISVLVVICIAALVFIIVICYRRSTSNHSQPSEVHANPTSTERNSSLDNTTVNYIEMRDVSLPEIHPTRLENYTVMRDLSIPEIHPTRQEHYIEMRDVSLPEIHPTRHENYIEMRDVSLPEIHHIRHENYIDMRDVSLHETRNDNSAIHRERETTPAGYEQMGNYYNRHESLSTNRTSIEHIYESEYI